MKLSHASSSAVILVFSCLLIAVPANSQENVHVTVSVTNPGNAPVLNLLKGEFSVQDSGKPQVITSFAAPNDKPGAPPQLQPNEFSNVPDFRETSGAIFVVFDTIHTRYLDERDERVLILKFLGKAAQAKHAVTLAILSDKGLTVYHDYHTGSDVLLAAMAKAGLGGMKGVAAPPGLGDAAVIAEAARLTAFSKGDQSNAAAENQLLRSSIDMLMNMFQDVGLASAGLPGRKALVWVTNAVPFDVDPKTMQFKSLQQTSHGVAVDGVAVGGSKDQLTSGEIKRVSGVWRQTMRALFDGGVAVYPVEVRGSESAASNTLSQIAMKGLAQLTGGKAFFGSNDPFPEILTISNGNTAGYVLGYSTETPVGTDLCRTQVMANRANTESAQPAGYFPYEGTTKSRAGAEVGLAMTSPLQYTGIRFKVTVAGIEEGTGGKKKVNLVISLPGDAGILNEATGAVDVGFLAVATNAKGEKVGNMNEGAGGKFPPDAVAHIKELGFQLKRSFEVSPGECTVRFLVRDNQTGRMGDVFFPLDVK
jgi:VWFA-related protein